MKKLIALVVVGCGCVAYAADYYWTGEHDADPSITVKTNQFTTASNWALANGSVATAYPKAGDTCIFTNDTNITVARSADLKCLHYRFEGKNVNFNRHWPKTDASNKRFTLSGGGSMVVASAATHYFNYSVDLYTANFGGSDKTFTVDAVKGVDLQWATYGTVNLQSPATLIKRGTGKLTISGKFAWSGGAVQLEEGTFYVNNASGHTYANNTLEVVGTAAKTLYLYGSAGAMNLAHYVESPEAEGTLTLYHYGNTQTFTFNGAYDTRFSGKIVQDGGSQCYYVAWNPGADNTLSIVRQVYTSSTVGFKVLSGTMRFAEGAGAKSVNSISVSAGAKLLIDSDASRDFAGTPITLADATAGVEVNGGLSRVSVKSVTVGGVAVPPGIYAAGDRPWLTGDGFLTVGTPVEPETTEATWVGGGASDSVLDPVNWGADELPDLTNGSLVATFAAGSRATVPADRSIRVKGLVFAAPSGFTLTGEAGAEVRVGSAGIATAGPNGAAYTNACPTFVYCSQPWSFASTNTYVIAKTGVVRSFHVDTVSATNNFYVYASSPDFCNLKFNGNIYVHADWALGGNDVTTRAMVDSKYVCLYGHSFSNKFYTTASRTVVTDGVLFNIQSGDNHFYGLVRLSGANMSLFQVADTSAGAAATLTFHGGLIEEGTNASAEMGPRLKCTVNIDDVPMQITKYFMGHFWNGVHYPSALNLNVASNVTTRGIMGNANGAKLNTTVPYALFATDADASGVGFHGSGTWDLCGCDQGVNILWSGSSSSVVKSTAAATVHVRDDRLNKVYQHPTAVDADPAITTCKVQVDRMKYQGGVSLSKEGVLDRWLINKSTSTGMVSVAAGRLIFAVASDESVTITDPGDTKGTLSYSFTPSTGSWPNAAAVAVSGTGILDLRHAKPFPKTATLSVEGDETDRIVIPAGVTVKCASLTVNGVPQAKGALTSGVVTGGGVLQVGPPGLYLFIR